MAQSSYKLYKNKSYTLYTGISCLLKNNRYTLVDFLAQSSLGYSTKEYKIKGVNYIKINSSYP